MHKGHDPLIPPKQGQGGLHNSCSGYDQVPVQRDGVHALGVCLGQPQFLLPHVRPQRGAGAHAGWSEPSLPSSGSGERETDDRIRRLLYTEIALRHVAAVMLTIFSSPLQDYLKKQVIPLFNHYKELTNNWNELPVGHKDQ